MARAILIVIMWNFYIFGNSEVVGLQVSLDTSISSHENVPTSCGMFTCTEDVSSSTDINGTDLNTNYTVLTITNLNIYTKPASKSFTRFNDNSDDGSLLVTLTASQLIVKDSSLNVVYSGHMTSSQASLRLGLMSMDSCLNEYTCKVVFTDQIGGQHSSKLSIDVNIDHKSNTDQCSTNPDTEWSMSDITTPQSCEKDMLPVAYQNMFPYLVIEPSEDSVAQVPIVCETHTLGGGWIVFQRRSTGNVDFYRGWEEYKNGFGYLSDDFWLGLQTIHNITASGTYELMVELEYNGLLYSAHYGIFSVADEDDNYRLMLEAYDGTAGDELSYNYGHEFTTYDKDNDEWSGINCAVDRHGAWWYNACTYANLNGLWLEDSIQGLQWKILTGDGNSVSFSQMMIRKVQLEIMIG